MFRALGDGLPEDIREAAGRVKIGVDNQTAVLDIPSDMDKTVKVRQECPCKVVWPTCGGNTKHERPSGTAHQS